ncbi:MAG: hypothetical protein EA393_11085 [Bacteroidetes bacterium]|nr:MAG: hypothetical protein EA393_11085 [Bacteroidota bacterium]
MLHRIFILFLVLFSFPGFLPGINIENGDRKDGFEFSVNRRSVSIPAKISNNLVVIPMRINDSPPLNFILDTGVNTTILTEPMIAYMFDFMPEDLVYVLGLGGEGIIEAGMSRNLTFNIRGITGENMNLVVIPEGILSFSELFGFPVHGIIGNDLFSRFPVRINYRTNTVRVFRESTYRIRRNSEIIPLEIENNKPYVHVHVTGDTPEKSDSLKLLLDMGATNPVFLSHSYTHLTEERIPSFLGKGISGELVGEMGRLEKITLGDFTLKRPLVAYPQKEFMAASNLMFEWEGILGAGILSRFHMIIDYNKERVILRKNRNFNKDFRGNLSGIEIIAQGIRFNEYKVNHVRKNSVAYEQDIRPGDKIINIDRMDISRMDIDEIVGIFNQSPGTVVSMNILRDNEILRKRIQLREDI